MITTSLLPLDTILPEKRAFISCFSCTVWTIRGPWLAMVIKAVIFMSLGNLNYIQDSNLSFCNCSISFQQVFILNLYVLIFK